MDTTLADTWKALADGVDYKATNMEQLTRLRIADPGYAKEVCEYISTYMLALVNHLNDKGDHSIYYSVMRAIVIRPSLTVEDVNTIALHTRNIDIMTLILMNNKLTVDTLMSIQFAENIGNHFGPRGSYTTTMEERYKRLLQGRRFDIARTMDELLGEESYSMPYAWKLKALDWQEDYPVDFTVDDWRE